MSPKRWVCHYTWNGCRMIGRALADRYERDGESVRFFLGAVPVAEFSGVVSIEAKEPGQLWG